MILKLLSHVLPPLRRVALNAALPAAGAAVKWVARVLMKRAAPAVQALLKRAAPAAWALLKRAALAAWDFLKRTTRRLLPKE